MFRELVLLGALLQAPEHALKGGESRKEDVVEKQLRKIEWCYHDTKPIRLVPVAGNILDAWGLEPEYVLGESPENLERMRADARLAGVETPEQFKEFVKKSICSGFEEILRTLRFYGFSSPSIEGETRVLGCQGYKSGENKGDKSEVNALTEAIKKYVFGEGEESRRAKVIFASGEKCDKDYRKLLERLGAVAANYSHIADFWVLERSLYYVELDDVLGKLGLNDSGDSSIAMYLPKKGEGYKKVEIPVSETDEAWLEVRNVLSKYEEMGCSPP